MDKQKEDFETALSYFEDLQNILQPDLVFENVKLENLEGYKIDGAIRHAKGIVQYLEAVQAAQTK